jgi:hypothetical protein
MFALDRTVILWSLIVEGTFKAAFRQSSRARSNSEVLGRDVMGAATKSSSAESSTTTAGRTFEPAT